MTAIDWNRATKYFLLVDFLVEQMFKTPPGQHPSTEQSYDEV